MTDSLSPEQKADEVIQADRDLFNLLFHIPAIRQREVNDGSRDYTEEMQAIARHRISSRTIAIEEARRAVWDAIGPLINKLPPHRARDGSCYVTAAHATDVLISSLKDQSV